MPPKAWPPSDTRGPVNSMPDFAAEQTVGERVKKLETYLHARNAKASKRAPSGVDSSASETQVSWAWLTDVETDGSKAGDQSDAGGAEDLAAPTRQRTRRRTRRQPLARRAQ